ncbi:MAG: tyrosine-type recombinase/integrase [bacterium]|nr:tyrosine-type recombinase/integrase [bacterium]
MKYGIERTLERMDEELKLVGYSPKTVSSYRGAAGRFLRHTDKPSNRLTHEDVRRYLLYLADGNYASSTINQSHFAIRFLYRDVLNKKAWRLEHRLQKRPQRVPIDLSRVEVLKLFQVTDDVKLKTIWMTLYSTGLRLSEALKLKVSDIDSQDMRILVIEGKGKKDRYTVLARTLLLQLRVYWRAYRPTEWLFYGRDREHPMVLRTAQKAFKECKNRAGIRKKATPHSLRHSFATHSMEDGTNLLYIRDLLGHKAIQSTLIYLKVTPEGIRRLVNPLDQLAKLAREKEPPKERKPAGRPKERKPARRPKERGRATRSKGRGRTTRPKGRRRSK